MRSRGRGRHSRRGENVGQRLFEGEGGRPTRGVAQVGVVADHPWRVDRPNQRRIGHEANGSRGVGEEQVGDFLNADAAPGADVVHVTGRAAFREEAIRAHDVTDIGQVAHGSERSHGDLVDAVAFRARDSRRERRHDELV